MASFGGFDGGVYFDAVLSKNGEVLHNGTPDEIRAWLKANPHRSTESIVIVVGKTLEQKTYQEYMYDA